MYGSYARPARDLVLALQTDVGKDPGEYFENIGFWKQGRAKADPRDPTRHIIAALGASLGNLVPPTGHYDAGGRWHNDLLWAVGEHPFGPLSNSSAYQLDPSLINENTPPAET